MKYQLFTKKSLMLFAFAALVMIVTSCIKDELDGCYKLTLVVHNDKGDDITPQGLVSVATLFIFDENDKLLETRELNTDFILGRRVIELDYPENQKLHFVAWGNLKGNQKVNPATKADDLTVSLITENEMAQAPDSLFFGTKDVVVRGNGVAGGNQEIAISPKTGTIEMVTIGLNHELNRNEGLRASSTAVCDFYMDRTKSVFDRNGALTGDSVSYNPEGTWRSSEWETPQPQNFVEGQKMTGTLVVNGRSYPVTEAKNQYGEDQDITVTPFYNTRVEFRFNESGTLNARIIVTRWGTVIDDPDLKPEN